MKSLVKYLKDYKKETVLSPLFKLLEATLNCLYHWLWPLLLIKV